MKLKLTIARLIAADGKTTAVQAFDSDNWTKAQIAEWAEQEIAEQKAQGKRSKERLPVRHEIHTSVTVA